MIEIIWTYTIKPARRAEFEQRYASDGSWAQLFGRAAGYRGTTLLKDANSETRYATVDRWESVAALEAFKREFSHPYRELDQECTALTCEEQHVGTFEVRTRQD